MSFPVLRARRVPVALLLLASAAAGCQGGALPSTADNLTTAQAMLDLGQSLTSLREENAAVQAQLDSLRDVVAYQDSVLRQLAAAGGVSMRPPGIAPLPR